METKNDFSQFKIVVLQIFNNWFALKAAYDHGFGSVNSLQEIRDEIESVCDFFEKSNNIELDVIKAELEAFMDEEFNTILEDGSASDIANVLMKFWNLLNLQDKSQFEAEFQKLPNAQNNWITLNVNTLLIEHSTHAIDSERNQMDVDDNDDGWKVVSYRKRR